MLGFHDVLFMILLPAVLALVGFAALATLRRRPRSTLAGPGWDGAVVALAVGAAWVGIGGLRNPGDVHDWLPWFAMVIAVVIVLAPALRVRWALPAALVIVVAALLWLVISPLGECHGWSAGDKVLWFGGLGVGWLATIWSWRRAAQAATAGMAVSGLVAALIAVIGACSLFGGARHAMLAAPIGAALAALVVIGWWRRWSFPVVGVATAMALLLPLLLIFARFLDEVPTWALPLLALVGVAAWPTAFGPLRALAGWKRLLVVVAVAGLVAAPVLGYGTVKSIHDSQVTPD